MLRAHRVKSQCSPVRLRRASTECAGFTDAQVTFAPDLSDKGLWTFTLGVDNLLDEDIPTCYSCDLNSFDGTLYPIQGPFWYFRTTFAIE